jgi:hypothetical protein
MIVRITITQDSKTFQVALQTLPTSLSLYSFATKMPGKTC